MSGWQAYSLLFCELCNGKPSKHQLEPVHAYSLYNCAFDIEREIFFAVREESAHSSKPIITVLSPDY
jgi:hypothetical protein